MLFVGVAGSVTCLTLIFRSMRAVMGAGMSSCASGGPYVVANPCPDGVAWMLPVSIWVGIGLLLVASVAASKLGQPSIAWLAWPALFLSLGANFWQYGLDPVGTDGPVWGWLVCAVLFTLMGGGPLLLVLFGEDGIPGRERLPGRSAPPAAQRAAAIGTRIRIEATPPPFRRPPADADDLVGSLERLAQLHREGAIDDAEYRDAKRRLLEEP